MFDEKVRSMEERDIPAVAEMFKALYDHLFELGALYRLNPDWLDDYLQMMLDSRFGRVLVLDIGAEIAGFICLSTPLLGKKLIAEGPKNTGFISELYVDPAHRGRSFAKKLLSAAEDYFIAANIRNIHVEVLVENEAAASLYKKYGFEPSRTNYCKKIDGIIT